MPEPSSPHQTQRSNPLLIRLKDAVTYSKIVRNTAAWQFYMRGILSNKSVSRAARLTRALAMAESSSFKQRCAHAIAKSPGFDAADAWEQVLRTNPKYRAILRDRPALDRSIILKQPSPTGEKGVLLMTFEYNWARLLLGLSAEEFRWIDDRYDLILSTSWSPTDYAALALACGRIRGPVFVQPCSFSEVPIIEGFHPRLKCLHTMPCDWINPALYQPKPFAERTTDIVMVANWGEFKRHWDLFQALRAMPPSLRIILIGQHEGSRTVETIKQLADQFGVKQELTILSSIPIDEVARQQCNAKVSIIMTRREGCCVAAVESLFAGCALAMRTDAHVGPRAYINEHTGLQLRPGHIAEDLMRLLRDAGKCASRKWAEQHVAGKISRVKVNELLANSTRERGLPWTHDIILPQWRPHPTFARTEDQEAMRPAYDELYRRFPRVFSETLHMDSWK